MRLSARRSAPSPDGWRLLVPVKDSAHAKSRLGEVSGVRRPDLALAFARDTVRAALSCPAVASVTVVTGDEHVAAVMMSDGALVVGEGASGLNEAIAAAVGSMPADAGIAVLLGDLPALTAAELAYALDLAADHDMAFVPDSSGVGTTLLAAARPALLRARFGPGSALAHEQAGAVRLTGYGLERVRRDVDDLADLRAAERLGLGPHTRLLLREVDLGDAGRQVDEAALLEDRPTCT